jgi:hypothetical protein
MKKIILIGLVCLFGILQVNSQTYVYRVRVKTLTDQGWNKDTVWCQVFHEAKNFKDTFQVFDYKIFAYSTTIIGGDNKAIERGQYRIKTYTWNQTAIRDTMRNFLARKYNVVVGKVDIISYPQ